MTEQDAGYRTGTGTGAAGWPPAGHANPPGGYPAAPPAGATPKQQRSGRPTLITLTAFLVEVVLIAAGCNQAVSQHVINYGRDHFSSFLGQAAIASQTYAWRFTPLAGDTHHQWLGQTIAVLAVLVLTVLLMSTLVRGAITFVRALFGTWLSVIVATLLAAIVDRLIFAGFVGPPGLGRVPAAVFTSISGYAFAAGVVLGFVAGLIAALVAVATRRSPGPAAGGYPAAAPLGAPPPAQPGADGDRFAPVPDGQRSFDAPPRYASSPDPTRSDAPSFRKDEPAQRTAELPTVDESAQTTELPTAGSAAGSSAQSSAPSSQPARHASAEADPAENQQPGIDPRQTVQLPRNFPRPPDDDQLGHHPD